MKVQCSPELENTVHLYKNKDEAPVFPPIHQRRRRQSKGIESDACSKRHFEMTSQKIKDHTYYNTSVSTNHRLFDLWCYLSRSSS